MVLRLVVSWWEGGLVARGADEWEAGSLLLWQTGGMVGWQIGGAAGCLALNKIWTQSK